MRPAGVFVSGYCGGAGLVPSPGNNGTSKGSPTWRKNDVGPEAFPRHGAKTMSGQRRFPDMVQKRRRARGVSPTWRKNDDGQEEHPREGTNMASDAMIIHLADKQRCRER